MMRDTAGESSRRTQPSRDKLEELIAEFELDLTGITVVTECATGVYALTGPIAALAGAERVICLGRDSDFGSYLEGSEETRAEGDRLGVSSSLAILPRSDFAWSPEHNGRTLITNLFGVRPIDASVIANCPRDTVVASMCELWELRPQDVDQPACLRNGIRIVGTNEGHPLLCTLELVGLLALQLLHESGAEYASGRVAIVGSGVFGEVVTRALKPWLRERRLVKTKAQLDDLGKRLKSYDAVVVVDHESTLTDDRGWDVVAKRAEKESIPIVNISGFPWGRVKQDAAVWPRRKVPPRTMSRALDAVGVWPVLRLHTAGLKVGSLGFGPDSSGSQRQRPFAAWDVRNLVQVLE